MFRRTLLSILAVMPFAAARANPPVVLTARQAKEFMQAHPNAVIVDVRTPDEFQQGHIPGARNVPLSDIASRKLPAALADKSGIYLVYCRSGRRSASAAQILGDYGYKNILDFGGINDWPYEVVR